MKRLNATALGTTSFLVAVGVVFSLQTQVVAQSNDCPATPRIGYRCYQDRDIRARSGYPGSNTGTFSYSPPAGYRLMDYRETVHSRFGEGGNLNVDLVRGGAVTQIRRMISDYNRSLSDRKSRAESYAQWSIRVGGETEVIENALRENNSRLAVLEDSYSNVDRVNASVTVSGRCTKVVLGQCVDNQGGKYEGTVRFQLEYVGTPGAISAANDAVLRRVDAALQRFEQEAQAIRQQQQQSQQPPQTSQLSDVVVASYQSAFGRTPTQEELNYWLGRSRQETINMDILMVNHQGWLRGGNEINETIVRSYQAILSRSPNNDEINHWRSRISTDGLTYTDLIQAHQDWKRRGGT